MSDKTSTKPLAPTMQAQASTIALFGAVRANDVSLSAKLVELATDIAKQVEFLEMVFASKLALIEVTYATQFKEIAENRNTMATLRALIVARVAGDEEVEIKPPSKDGKTAAVFKKAANLNAGEAKKFAAELKTTMAEQDASPEQKAAKAKAEAEAKAALDKAASESALAALTKAREAHFAYVLDPANIPELTKRLNEAGYSVKKIPAPAAK